MSRSSWSNRVLSALISSLTPRMSAPCCSKRSRFSANPAAVALAMPATTTCSSVRLLSSLSLVTSCRALCRNSFFMSFCEFLTLTSMRLMASQRLLLLAHYGFQGGEINSVFPTVNSCHIKQKYWHDEVSRSPR